MRVSAGTDDGSERCVMDHGEMKDGMREADGVHQPMGRYRAMGGGMGNVFDCSEYRDTSCLLTGFVFSFNAVTVRPS